MEEEKKIIKVQELGSVPKNAVYMTTIRQLTEEKVKVNDNGGRDIEKYWDVYHYFLVDVTNNL